MRRGIGILPLKEKQHPQVGLRVQVFGLQLYQRFEFWDGELRPPLIEILLRETRVGCRLILREKRQRDEDCYKQSAEFFFKRIALASYSGDEVATNKRRRRQNI
jgi:hypothetical protein